MESTSIPASTPTLPESSSIVTLPVIDKAGSRPWKGIVWHHSAGPDGKIRDWPGIVKYHTSYRIDFDIVTKEDYERREAAKDGKKFEEPWSAVGYHGGIELVGTDAVFMAGRPLSLKGAHAGVAGASNRFNDEYLGLCAMGNYDVVTPPGKIWGLALAVTREFMKTFEIINAHVIGHREVYDKLGVPRQKSCPGKHWNMDLFREQLKV